MQYASERARSTAQTMLFHWKIIYCLGSGRVNKVLNYSFILIFVILLLSQLFDVRFFISISIMRQQFLYSDSFSSCDNVYFFHSCFRHSSLAFVRRKYFNLIRFFSFICLVHHSMRYCWLFGVVDFSIVIRRNEI